MSLGGEFIRYYLMEYCSDEEVEIATCHTRDSARSERSRWTSVMRNVLTKTAKQIGFNEKPFMELAKRDLVFHTNGQPDKRKIMAIEHENDAKDILKPKEEVDKLLITDADLRVLVTLVRKTKDLLHQRRALASKMQRKIEKWVPANRDAEFLLIVGRYRFFEAEYRPEQEPWTIYHWHRRRGRWLSHTTLVNEQNWKKLAKELKDGLAPCRSTIVRLAEIL